MSGGPRWYGGQTRGGRCGVGWLRSAWRSPPQAALLRRAGDFSGGAPNTSGRRSWRVTFPPVASSMARHLSAGTFPLAFQLLTTFWPKPIAVASFPTPPAVSIAAVSASMADIITIRDSRVNTFRVRRTSHGVKNGQMAFSDRLKALRIASGMTQEALALACGWSGQSRIANYESSAPKSREPKVAEIPVIAKALGVSISELFEDAEAPSRLASHAGRIDPDMLAESIAALRQVAKNQGYEYDPETHPDVTVNVYELRRAMPPKPTTADVIDFGAKVAERLQRLAEVGIGQSDGGQAGGADRGRAKGQSKA